jgi:DNA-binding beta-propeller fold protein YncE
MTAGNRRGVWKRNTMIAALLATSATLHAAQQPLGLVERADDKQIDISFDAGAQLVPGTVLAIYGSGKVQKHPLTKQVIIEDRKLVAKAQVLSVQAGKVQARIAWKSGEPLVAGMDAVPLPSEASPNSPPAFTGALPAIKGQLQDSVAVKLPITDQDGDAVSYTWRLEGAAGQVGRLSARTTLTPEVSWITPGLAGTATLMVTARDRLGQEFVGKVPLQAEASDQDWRKRDYRPFHRVGGGDNRITRCERDAAGRWWAIDRDNILRISSGWMHIAVLGINSADAPKQSLALVPWHGQLYVLDGEAKNVSVYDGEGERKRRLAACEKPTDLDMDADGTLYIADQESGGVLVYENDGRFRARLGKAGSDKLSFAGLTRIALAANGDLFALDAQHRQIHRYDRFQHRLDSWDVQGDPKNTPIDLACHARGLMVLMGNGLILVYNDKGIAGDSYAAASSARFASDLGDPSAITVDIGGDIFVTYPERGLIARYDADGRVTGLRGNSLWKLASFVADGRGTLYGLDSEDAQISVFDSEGWLTSRIGGFSKKGGLFSEPLTMSATPDGQALCVIDSEKKNIVRIATAKPSQKPLIFGQAGKNNGQFAEPIAIATDEAGRTYVLDEDLHRVAVFDAQGRFQFNFGHYERGKGADELEKPKLIAVSPAGDAAYVYDYEHYDVKKFALAHDKSTATHVTNAGGKGDGPGQVRRIAGLACDRIGLLYVLDSGRNDLQIWDFRGNNAVCVQTKKLSELGIKKPEILALVADGQAYVGVSGELHGFRWW